MLTSKQIRILVGCALVYVICEVIKTAVLIRDFMALFNG